MTPEDRKAIEDVIRATVNGKIDAINAKIDQHNERHEDDMKDVKEHIEKTRPIVEGLQGAKVIESALKWLAGVAAAYIVIKSLFTGNT